MPIALFRAFSAGRSIDRPRQAVAALCCVVLVGYAASVQARPDRPAPPDPVVLQFSTVGDSRQDPDRSDVSTLPLSGQDAIWLQNSRALARILREVKAQGSPLLFFNGDLIHGYGVAGPVSGTSVAEVMASDLMAFHRQYGFWRGMVAPSLEEGLYVVPVAGNHELQSKAMGRRSQAVNEDAWRANMGDLIVDEARMARAVGQRPTQVQTQGQGALDGLSSDQAQLSYSFDLGRVHFAVINTDPAGRDNTAPVNWLRADLQAAKARGARHVFVFGHKPAFSHQWHAGPDARALTEGLDRLPDSRDAFWQVLQAHGASYFCGHQHIFNMSQPRGAPWQVVVGSGGSPFDAQPGMVTRHPATDRMYAWVTVRVRRSGRVEAVAHGFDERFGRTRTLQRVNLTQP